MDPKGRDEMLSLIRDLAHNKGMSLILSSHLLPDVEYVCDYVIVLDKGAVAAQGRSRRSRDRPGGSMKCGSRATGRRSSRRCAPRASSARKPTRT